MLGSGTFQDSFRKAPFTPPLPCHRKRPALELQCHFEDCEESLDNSEEAALVDPNLMPTNDTPLAQDALHDDRSYSSTSSTPSIKAPHPTSRSTLMDMVRMQQWQFILEHPDKSTLLGRKLAKYHDADGLYPLHWASSGQPPIAIIEALLESYPSAARKRDHEGSTAVHFATHYSASVAVVEKLLLAYPEAVRMQDKYGRTPLYHAVEKSANINVIQALVRADEKSTALMPCLPKELRDINQALGKHDGILRRAMSIRTPLFLAWTAVLGDAQARKTFQGKKWDKAMHLLVTAYDVKSTGSSVVNDSASLAPVPAEVFLQAAIVLDMYLPDAVVPIAIKSFKETASKTCLTTESQDSAPFSTGGEFLAVAAETEQYSEQRSKDLIRMLLEAFPSAASYSTSAGQTPLVLAAAAGKLWHRDAMKQIFSAAPTAVSQPDPVSGLPPFLLAASASSLTAPRSLDVTLATNLRLWLERNDPYNLLARKGGQYEPPIVSENDFLQQELETAKLETIFQFIQSDPAVLSHYLCPKG